MQAGNYTVNASHITTADITERGIEVTADSGSKTYGQADPALTYQVTEGSLAEGDDFSGALTRENGQGAGGYDILQGTLSAGPNYDLSYVGATFTIDPKALTVTGNDTTKVLGAANPAFTVRYDGFINGESSGVLGGTLFLRDRCLGVEHSGQLHRHPEGTHQRGLQNHLRSGHPEGHVCHRRSALQRSGRPHDSSPR